MEPNAKVQVLNFPNKIIWTYAENERVVCRISTASRPGTVTLEWAELLH